MNDTLEGAGSNAAQDAAADPAADRSGEPGPQRGLFGRLFDALAPQEAAPKPQGRGHAAIATLRNLRVDDIAIPKSEIAAVPQGISREELIAVFRENGYSRLPVYEGELDRALGFVLLKDLVLRHGFDLTEHPLELEGILRPLLFVPPSMPLASLLHKMQAERIHMALVIDEFGGVEGLVTIEDLIEQVVGEIEDEHDTDEEVPLWNEVSPGVWVVEARAELDDFRAASGFDLTAGMEDEDVDTVGGLVFVLSGYVPGTGAVVAHPEGWKIKVLKADQRHVERLRISRPDPDAAVNGAGA